jgi:hypothetical protein
LRDGIQQVANQLSEGLVLDCREEDGEVTIPEGEALGYQGCDEGTKEEDQRSVGIVEESAQGARDLGFR